MKRILIALQIALFISIGNTYSQGIGINNNGSQPDASSMLDVVSTTKGVLLPRLNTNQMLNISLPATGLTIFNTDSMTFCLYDGSQWKCLCVCYSIVDTIISSVCGDSITDSRDGQKYATVQIGTQCWMAQNLNVGSRINSYIPPVPPSILPTFVSQSNTAGIFEKYCYDNLIANCDTFGGLYQWNHAVQYWGAGNPVYPAQGICPSGWHIPTDAEWYTLESYLWATGNCSNTRGEFPFECLPAGKELKVSGLSGFDALIAGYIVGSLNGGTGGGSSEKGLKTIFWTSDEVTTITSNAVRRLLNATMDGVSRGLNDPKVQGYSVRCIKD